MNLNKELQSACIRIRCEPNPEDVHQNFQPYCMPRDCCDMRTESVHAPGIPAMVANKELPVTVFLGAYMYAQVSSESLESW